MKKILIIAALCFVSAAALAQDYNWAIGVRGGGDDSGVTVKHILSDYNAIELTGNFQYARGNMARGFALSALYEWNLPVIADGFLFYYGFGPHIGSATMTKEDHDNYGMIILGATGVVGLEYKLYSIPLAFSLDYRPFVNALPQPKIFFSNVGLGIKVCF